MDHARIAHDWIAAWNARDLARICDFYAEDIELVSPLVVDRLGRADGTLRGKDELRAYFAIGTANPALRFTLEDVRSGVNAMTILYTREGGKRCADMMQFDKGGRCIRMIACYAA